MKKVFIIGCRYFWACNGKEIRNAFYFEWKGDKVWLTPTDGPRYRIKIVDPPAGRCPHCGEKL